ncbi:MAG: ribonuclease HI family protein [Fimbriimonadales bacterium]|nr:ribonuclease HI family protein [Fimbriimonadales bacterium]MDW8051135.1 ribonuclease HI family protein [Armatimonadota bacterium]
MKVFLYTDGASIGNPGVAGIAYLLKDAHGSIIASGCEPIGIATNNQAEYRALLRGLTQARALGATEIEWFSDSELLVRQWVGAYKVRHPALQRLLRRAKALAKGIQVTPHAVARNSLPEMAQVDRWARQAARQQLRKSSEPTTAPCSAV